MSRTLLAVALLWLLGLHVVAAPDFTRGDKPDDTHDWTLGPTGARGWISGRQGQTTDARQILVTAVAKGSPADGALTRGDVILGVDGKPFDGDARIQLANAITEAEKEPHHGLLRLLRWRGGHTENIELKLPVMGAYSDTAPYGCAKSQRIFELGCRAIAKKPLADVSIPNDLNALALLASGRSEYQPLVAAYARKVAAHQPGGYVTWGYAYATLFLAEYALATRDAAVADGLRRLALDIARGQSGVGTWGHGFARADGILNGYGAMNQPGIVLTLAMLLAREAGVNDPALDRAILKSAQFLRWYVGKGSIPYGDHDPWPWHEDNGKCSSAAVLYDLLGDREAANFFAKMATAAYAERESGHTGNFFNILWAIPGVSRCGPLATSAYFKETAWYYDLARGWDGTFLYQGTPANWGGHRYNNWDCTGAYLLTYALPLKSLYLTGRKPGAATPLSREETAEVIAAGRDFSFWTEKNCYDHRDTETLLAGLSSWSPAVRKRSAQALSRRDGDFVPRLLSLLASPNPNARYGACEALGLLGPKAEAAAPRLLALLQDPDPWLQCLAAEALPQMGPATRKAAVPELLRLTVRRNPADPRAMVQRYACSALFSPRPGKHEPKSILAESLDGVNRELLYPAIKAVLENQDGTTRSSLQRIYPHLDERDIAALLPFIVKAVKEPAPSGEMFADGIRLAGVDLLSRLRIREAMAMCVELMEPERWGQNHRIPKYLEYLARYGSHAAPWLPQLRQMREAIIKKDRKNKDQNELAVAIEKTIAKIEANQKPTSLISLDEFVRAATASR